MGDRRFRGDQQRVAFADGAVDCWLVLLRACVDAVTGESDTTNNCSLALTVTVDGPPPDLVVLGPNVSEIREDRTFWLIATVHNQGAGGSAATTVAVQTLDRRHDHDIRHDGGHGRGQYACPFGRLRGNDQADGADDGWHVLLRRVRGCGAQGVRHHQQLLVVVRETGRKLKPLRSSCGKTYALDSSLKFPTNEYRQFPRYISIFHTVEITVSNQTGPLVSGICVL